MPERVPKVEVSPPLKNYSKRAITPPSTVERVDCMVAEQYNIHHCEANPRFQRSAATSLGLLAVIGGAAASE